jgi:hypothetical protein
MDDIRTFLKDTKDAVLVYDGNEYSPVVYWNVKSTDAYTAEKADWQGMEHNVRVYDDPEKRFIFDEFFQILCHRKDLPLPDYRYIQNIEKIERPLHDPITIVEESIIKEIVELISQPYDTDTFKTNSPSKNSIVGFNVFFKNCPAYYYVSIIEAEDGSYGIVILEWESIDKRNYVPIPSDSQIMFYLW